MKALETSKPLWKLLAHTALLMVAMASVAACTERKASPSQADRSTDIPISAQPDASVVDPCRADPAPGCPCDKEREGDLLACGKVKSRVDGRLTCGLGYSTCTGGVWGDCAINNSITVDAPSSSSSKTLGLGGPVRCSDNPCAPGCVEFPDTPDGLDGGTCVVVNGSNMSLDPACGQGDFQRDYDMSSQCKPGEGITWGLFSWSSQTPADSKVEFFVQTADTAAALSAAPKSALRFSSPQGPSPLVGQPAVARATPPPSTQNGAVSVDATLEALVWPRNKPFLRVTAHLVRGTDNVSVPTLKSWDLQALCRPCPSGLCNCPGVAGAVCGGSCTDLWIDNSNCGACGTDCTATSQTCVSGQCKCPSANQGLCSGTCTDLTTNANCGTCGNACPAATNCVGGACVCPGGTTVCGGVCKDLQTDANNCGACGNKCSGGQTCSGGICNCPSGTTLCGGVCVDTKNDNANCGSCSNVCVSTSTCQSSTCKCPGTTPQLCGAQCTSTSSDKNNCGACGQACGSWERCSSGTCSCDTANPGSTVGKLCGDVGTTQPANTFSWGSPVTCDSTTWPNQLTLTISGSSCDCVNGIYTLTKDSKGDWRSDPVPHSGGAFFFKLLSNNGGTGNSGLGITNNCSSPGSGTGANYKPNLVNQCSPLKLQGNTTAQAGNISNLLCGSYKPDNHWIWTVTE